MPIDAGIIIAIMVLGTVALAVAVSLPVLNRTRRAERRKAIMGGRRIARGGSRRNWRFGASRS